MYLETTAHLLFQEALEAMAGLPTLVEMKIDRIPGVQDRNRTGIPALIGAMRFSNAPAAVMSFDEPTLWRAAGQGAVDGQSAINLQIDCRVTLEVS